MARSIEEQAKEAFTERFEKYLDGDGYLKDDAELPQYWQDDIHEIADTLVPVYNTARIEEWLEAGCPGVDDTGLIDGVTDVFQIVGVILYEQYSQALWALADEAGFNA